MYPLGRAARFFLVIIFSFFILLLHSIDKRQTYARLQLIDVTSGWYHHAESSQDKYPFFGKRGEKDFDICKQTYGVEFQRHSEYSSHKVFENLHLNSESFVIEVGGFKGELMRELFQLYDIGLYVTVEPVWQYYKVLISKLKHLPQGKIQAHNIGLGAKDDKIQVKPAGNRTSSFGKQRLQEEFGKNGNESEQMADLSIRSVERFFQDMGIGGEDQLDLLILDCEGCEYDVLDYLLKSPDVLHYIRVIMFQSHKFKGHRKELVRKYCTYQQLLPLTHEIQFQNKFSWEVWTLRNKM
ncbi:uncharacterized protein LOC132548294 [Ylistrum balloti]|uniref:uncharacterized protein LOC132548294 n=1 Tax=Ylistrum balloti TaxID=509963 RepID=UPI002905C414|nr:uncharacterized protein LOC132548294 [Ylistrum balloti]